MATVRVRAWPGGRADLHFDKSGYRVEPRSTGIGWLFSDAGTGVCVLLALGFGIGAGVGYAHHHPTLAIVLAILAAPCALVALGRLLAEALAEVLGYAMLALLVIAAPLLVFPGVRRWLRNRRAAGSGIRDPASRGYVAATSVLRAEVQHDADTITIVVERDGGSLRYAATGEAGQRLEHEFSAVLGDRLVTVH